MAVGDYHTLSPGYDVALAYRWSSGTWSSPIYPLNPTGSTSDGVGVDSCPSAACVAVNRNRNSAYEHETLAESVTATNVWSTQLLVDYLYPTFGLLDSPPSPSGAKASHFEGVSCTGEACMAVGDYTTASGVEGLAERNW
jgi:hypothetical protein